MNSSSSSQQYIDHLREVEARFQRTYSQWSSDSDMSPTSDTDPVQTIAGAAGKEAGGDGADGVLKKTAVEDLLSQISGGYLTLKDGRKLYLTEPNAQLSGDIKRIRRPRTIYTSQQVNALNHIFCRTQYLSMPERTAVAGKLGLSQTQVKVWFQNKRSNLKKHIAKGMRGGSGGSGSGAYSPGESGSEVISPKSVRGGGGSVDFDPAAMITTNPGGSPTSIVTAGGDVGGVIAFSGGGGSGPGGPGNSGGIFPERSLAAGVSTVSSPTDSHPGAGEIFGDFFNGPVSNVLGGPAPNLGGGPVWTDRWAPGAPGSNPVADWLSHAQQPSWSDSSGEFYPGSGDPITGAGALTSPGTNHTIVAPVPMNLCPPGAVSKATVVDSGHAPDGLKHSESAGSDGSHDGTGNNAAAVTAGQAKAAAASGLPGINEWIKTSLRSEDEQS